MTITARNRARTGVALMLAAAFALVLLVGGPSGAAPRDANFAVQSGSLTVGASTFNLDPEDGGGLTGTYDDETGDLTGTLLVPPIVTQLNVEGVGLVDVTITITQDGAGGGSIDPETGAAAFNATVTLGIAAAVGGTVVTPPDCRITPVNLTFEGTYDEATMVLSISDEGYVLPPSTGCGDAIGPLIDAALMGDTSAVLELVSTDDPITPPTTTSTTTSTTTGLLYENCDAARAAGAAPVYRDDPGYGPHLDANNDGVGCENTTSAARPITTTARFTG